MKYRFIVILDLREEVVFYFKYVDAMLRFLRVNSLSEVKRNPWVKSIIEVKEILYEQDS